MLFNSLEFAVFLPIVLIGYYSLSRRAQNIWLIIASYIFYGWWDWRFLFLIFISTIVDYSCGLGMGSTHVKSRKKFLLATSVTVNLGILGFFKYFNFFADSFAVLLEYFGLSANAHSLAIILPVGISFYTFQTMAYSIDVYRGRITPTRRFENFALYVAFFPQLVAGPIERPKNLLPQISKKRIVSENQLVQGFLLILTGLFRKVVIADTAARFVDLCFNYPGSYSSPALALGVVFFAIQIYADFSGYTNIARGVAMLLGFELMQNFKHPYLAANIAQFWRRWHISLSTWFRDYLYIPLGGNRKGRARTYFNLFVTMLLCGLWHGASWNFVAWGGMHGIFLAVHRFFYSNKKQGAGNKKTKFNIFLYSIKVTGTFALVCFAWIFFRASDMQSALSYIASIAACQEGSFAAIGPHFHKLVFYIMALYLTDVARLNGTGLAAGAGKNFVIRGAYFAFLILYLMLYGGADEMPFIYFQF